VYIAASDITNTVNDNDHKVDSARITYLLQPIPNKHKSKGTKLRQKDKEQDVHRDRQFTK